MQAALWGARAKDWAELETTADPIYNAALERLNIREGDKLLDIGCGSGRFCGLAHAKGAKVFGFDATPELLAIAKERNPECTFDEGDMEAVPYRNAEFDFVTAFNSFQFAANPQTAIYEAKRVMKVGGLLLAVIWGKPEQCEARFIFEAMKELAPPPPGARGPFSLSMDGALENLLKEVRLDIIDSKDVDCAWEFPDEGTLTRRILAAGPSTRVINEVGEEKTKEAILKAVEPFKTPEGGYRLKNVYRYVTAEV